MRRSLQLLLVAAVAFTCLQAQKGVTTTPSVPTTTTPGSTTGTANPAPSAPNPNSPAPTTQTTTTAQRPISISGEVITDDASPLPRNISIQSVCSTRQRTVAHASSGGSFSFEWASTTSGVVGDASDNGRFGGITLSGNGGTTTTSTPTGYGGTPARMIDPMANCDLRAEAPGYTSTRVSLYDRLYQEVFDVGAIVLHRLSGDEGRLVSVLALKAPKDAKKYFDKGTELARANKQADAAASFQKAVAGYPRYADAWVGLALAEIQIGAKDAASEHFRKAMELDDKLTTPWQELGYLASDQSKWEEALHYLDQAVRLDPMNSAKAWYFNAMANFNLGRYEQAERSVRAELKLDKNPQGQYLLGLVLIARKDLKGGAEALRDYLETSPNAKDVESARRQLARLESQLGR